MLTVVDDAHDTHAPVAVGGDMLDELAREGARRMLAAALQAEVAAYVDAHVGEVRRAGPPAGGPQRQPPPALRQGSDRGWCGVGQATRRVNDSAPIR
ncbi:MAG: hypothetical protein IPH27_03665 [Actinomycetales bacterium]|nr:hypothetical protein [Candidatus Phosphoribacter baldrii]